MVFVSSSSSLDYRAFILALRCLECFVTFLCTLVTALAELCERHQRVSQPADERQDDYYAE